MLHPTTVPEGLATWIEVRTDALLNNLRAVRAHAAVDVCAVVKANAYGHDIVQASKIFVAGGAAMLGVTRLEEARTLRDAGLDAPILIMAPGADANIATAIGCSFALDDPALIERLPEGAKVHLKVNTGMGRFGVRVEDASSIARELAVKGALEGVMTHSPDASSDTAKGAAARFSLLVHGLRGEGLKFKAHAAGSSALLNLPEWRFDMVRVGTLLYGQDPPSTQAPWHHTETFAWFAKVGSVRALAAGDAVGYGSEYVARRPTAAVTLPIGWADGYGLDVSARSPSPRERAARIARSIRPDTRHVTAVANQDGIPMSEIRRIPVIGRIGMQATTFADPGASLELGAICQIPARRLTVSAAIPRLFV